MVISPNTQSMSRRNILARCATALALPAALLSIPAMNSIPAAASIPTAAPALSPQEEYDRFHAAMKIAFDPVAYVDYLTSHNDDCFAIYRGEQRIMYKCWLMQFEQGNNCDKFLAELQRRGWAYQVLPGEKYWDAEDRVKLLRIRDRIGLYAHVETADAEHRVQS